MFFEKIKIGKFLIRVCTGDIVILTLLGLAGGVECV